VDGTEYWGKGIEEVNKELKNKYGKTCRTVVIGPAGENLVKFAAILNEAHHAFGRTGFGAVLGSKNLKAIVVKAVAGRIPIRPAAADVRGGGFRPCGHRCCLGRRRQP